MTFPKTCLSCGWDLYEGEEVLCYSCFYNLPRASSTLDHTYLERVFWGRCRWRHALGFLKMEKTGVVRELIHALKYKNQPEVGIYLGEKLGKEFAKVQAHLPWDCIVPVPLHPKKLISRGYNQCFKLALGLSKAWGIPIREDVLFRSIQSESQTKKNRLSRLDLQYNPFYASESLSIRGWRILIVDDVVTTGSTLEQCYRALENRGAELSVATFALPVHNRIVD